MRPSTSAEPAARDSILLSVTLAALISVGISWTLLQDVWSKGAFFDTDDATRMAQVRDWMAGQAWYDLNMHRLGFPGAEPMHWTRLVDAPIAALIRIASLFLDPEMAERAARIAFPLLLSIGVFGVGALVAIELMGGATILTACLVLSLAGLSILQFQPGRVDHHAPQMLLLLTSGLFLLRSIGGPHPWRAGFWSAACLAASMAISLENLPAAVAIGACFACLWATQGATRRRALSGFGCGLLIASPVLFALTTPPARWLTVSCDAQSFMHISLMLLGGGACVIMALLDRRIPTQDTRWACLAVIAFGMAMITRVAFPQCGLDPYGDIDPLVRSDWLNRVKEAYSLLAAWRHGLQQFVLVNFIPAVTGVIGAAIAIYRCKDDARLRWIVWLAVTLTTFAVAGYRVGYVQTLQVIGSFGAVYLLSLLPPRWQPLRIPGAFALSVVALAFVLPAVPVAKTETKEAAHCTAPRDAEGVAMLRPGLLLAPIDEGAYLLAFTKHQIVAAPYHRNNEGNRLEVEAFRQPAEDALALLQSRDVDYVAICGEERRKSPLIQGLIEGMPGATRLDVPGAYQVWRIERSLSRFAKMDKA